ADVPEARERDRELQLELRSTGGCEVVRGGAEILMLAVERLEPLRLLLAAKLRLRPLGQRETPLGVSLANAVAAPGLAQPLRGVLPDGLEQRVAHRRLVLGRSDERRVDEAAQRIERSLA